MKIYPNLQLLLIDFNKITQDYLFMGFNNFGIIHYIMSLFILIRFASALTYEPIICIVPVGSFSALFLVLSYIKLGEVHRKSQEVLTSWRIYNKINNPTQKKIFKKFIKSRRPLRIELGGFGYYQKPGSIRMVGKLVVYIVKFLMLMKKFGV